MKSPGTRLLAFQWKPPTSLSARTICDITGDFDLIWYSVRVYWPVLNFSNFDFQVWFVILDKQLYWGLIHTTPEKFENAALFQRLDIVHNKAPWKQVLFKRKHCSNLRNLKTPALCFNVDGKHFQNGTFPKRWRHDFLKHKSKMTGDCCVFKFLQGVDEKHLMCFQSD